MGDSCKIGHPGFCLAPPYIRPIFVATKPTSVMKAVVITRPGGPEVLALKDLPQPLPRVGEVLIRVHAAGLNRSDLYSRKGSYGALRENEIPGLEIAGVVEAVGPAGPSAIRWR